MMLSTTPQDVAYRDNEEQLVKMTSGVMNGKLVLVL